MSDGAEIFVNDLENSLASLTNADKSEEKFSTKTNELSNMKQSDQEVTDKNPIVTRIIYDAADKKPPWLNKLRKHENYSNSPHSS